MPIDMINMDQRFSKIAGKQGSDSLTDYKRSWKSGMRSHTDKIHIFDFIQTDIFDHFDDFIKMKPRSDFRHHTSIFLMIIYL